MDPEYEHRPQQLLHQILEVRERGYAVNISENREHVCGVAAAVIGKNGRPIAAVVISMPTYGLSPSDCQSGAAGCAQPLTRSAKTSPVDPVAEHRLEPAGVSRIRASCVMVTMNGGAGSTMRFLMAR